MKFIEMPSDIEGRTQLINLELVTVIGKTNYGKNTIHPGIKFYTGNLAFDSVYDEMVYDYNEAVFFAESIDKAIELRDKAYEHIRSMLLIEGEPAHE